VLKYEQLEDESSTVVINGTIHGIFQVDRRVSGSTVIIMNGVSVGNANHK